MKEWLSKLQKLVGEFSDNVPWGSINKSGSNLSELQTRLHADLQNLSSDDHQQYVLASGARNITGQQEFEDTIVLPKTSGKGIKVDTTTPTYGWKDLLGIIQPKTSGVGSPTLETFRAGQVRRFCYAAGEDGDGEFHIPHDWAPGTDLYIHVHWGHNGTAISGSLVINWYFTYAKGHNQANFSAEINATQTISTPDIATVPQYRHRIDEFQLSAASPSTSQLDTDDIEPDGLIMYHWDVTTIPTITGGAPNKPFLFYIDLHYQTTNMPTKQKAPNFYS